MTKIGVVADTHGMFDPCLTKLLQGVDVILHAGDMGGEDILDRLRNIALTHAVRGNVDGPESNLPLTLKLDFVTAQVEMLHILPVPQSELEAWAEASILQGAASPRGDRLLRVFDEKTRVVIFGHSHKPCLAKLGDVLFFNPGSAGAQRFSLPRCYGLLEIFDDAITAAVLPLKSYNGNLPEAIRLEHSS